MRSTIDRVKVINGSIFIVWLFHVSAMIGLSLGFEEWFISKTPLNLLLLFLFTIVSFRIDTVKKILITFCLFSVGMLVEIVGTNYGWLFGEYTYGENLGPKWANVPWMIGVNWAVLVLVTADISIMFSKKHRMLKAAIGAGLMVFLDLFIEGVAPRFDFWEFEGPHVPIQNYLAWFIIAFMLQLLVRNSKIEGDRKLSLQIFFVQLVFFGFCYFLYA